MFASTFLALSRLACSCNHPPGTHQQIAGVRTASGHYLSRDTAEDPPDLASQFAQIILPLLSSNGIDLDLASYPEHLPSKSLSDPPFARQDGAGFCSQADWSSPHPRLVLDSTVCGVNPQSGIPEKASLPTAEDVIRSYPRRQSRQQLSGVSFDVKSAHKQIRSPQISRVTVLPVWW